MYDRAFFDTLTYDQVAKTIDHSLLKPELTVDEVVAGCQLALQYHVASVCVKPSDVACASSILTGTDVKVGTVVGFPHGSSTSATKAFESRQAIQDGAEELDMVINIGRMRSNEDDYVYREIAEVVEVAVGRVIVKVILENAYLSDDEKVRACKLAEKAGARFVKTSTGFAPTGATVKDIDLMRASVSSVVQIKAAHGVRTLDALLEMMQHGVTRIGATATQSILDDFKARKGLA
jgi:deoxyribose-phosphate aldolase